MNDLLASPPELVPAWDSAMQVYDRGSAHHSALVAEIASITAVERGLSTPDVETIGWAGTLHDVGMLAVPRGVPEVDQGP